MPSYSRGFRTFKDILIEGGIAKITFLNGDIRELSIEILEKEIARGVFRNVQWQEGRIHKSGFCLVFPAEPLRLRIPGDRIRILTDSSFAQDMKKHQVEQARYIGRRLLELRKERGIKSALVVERAGISLTSLQAIEGGKRESIEALELNHVLAAMGCTIGNLALSD